MTTTPTSTTTTQTQTMESLEDLLKRTIREGVPLFNAGKRQECYDLYMDTAKYACMQEKLAHSAVGRLLEQATDEAMELTITTTTTTTTTGGKREDSSLSDPPDYYEAAWVLRRCFDEILDLASRHEKKNAATATTRTTKASYMPVTEPGLDNPQGDDEHKNDTNLETYTSASTGALLRVGTDDIVQELLSEGAYWQDAKATCTSDDEIGQSLSDTAYILRALLPAGPRSRLNRTYNEDCFAGLEVVDALTTQGLAGNRRMATEKCNRLFQAGLFVPVSHKKESTFRDGTHLYRFPTQQELTATLDAIVREHGARPKDGTPEAHYVIALEATLEWSSSSSSSVDDETSSDQTSGNSVFSGVATHHLQSRRSSLLSREHTEGEILANLVASVETAIRDQIKDRKHLLKKYENVFVGNEAISTLVNVEKLFATREDAVRALDTMLQNGLIYHVTYDHGFEDKYLFYRISKPGDIKKSLDALAVLPAAPKGLDFVRQAALISRYKQYAGLDVRSILNAYYGCDTEEGWDLIDLQNWRDNMKRWGFGRREQQDDEMVDKLSPLCLNVDPEKWDVSGDEEWESPWGIAIFDQIPRSAFRGTPDAFKWDQLAIQATKVAIEKGYFEHAYKSTLNQFVVLLPLEHSESWEDQKLGVTLLLQTLATVAVEDEGWSDYEIVKRLEFSKRLTAAFLEHAQVIAKFKRYPHRNAAHGRTFTLEERIWLASDLVPRWAKSQKAGDAKNLIKTPVIPLKKLTRR